ncbi:MAG: Fe-S oxidoreductase, partial [Flavobacteriales bacterium]
MDALKYLPQILFSVLFLAGIGLFGRNVLKVVRNIRLGKAVNRNDNKGERIKTMVLVALGQSK